MNKLKELVSNYSYPMLVAASILIANDISPDTLRPEELQEFALLAENIDDLMQKIDEPRFTLYDYLDAVVNHPKQPNWAKLNQEAKENEDSFCDHLIKLAEDMRDEYSR